MCRLDLMLVFVVAFGNGTWHLIGLNGLPGKQISSILATGIFEGCEAELFSACSSLAFGLEGYFTVSHVPFRGSKSVFFDR